MIASEFRTFHRWDDTNGLNECWFWSEIQHKYQIEMKNTEFNSKCEM